MLVLATTSHASDLATLLEQLAHNARFEPSMRAEVRFETPRPDGARTSSLVLYGRGRTVRVETPEGLRALAKPGKCVSAAPAAAPRVVREQVIGGSAFLLEDLVPFTAGDLRVPLISDETPALVVVTGEPRPPSPYVLLVHTIPSGRPLVTASKYYRWEVSNLTKMTRVQDAVQVAGHWRARVIELQDLGPGGDTTTVTFSWHEQPDLPPELFTPRGLRTDVPR